jgi:hypothetical protein
MSDENWNEARYQRGGELQRYIDELAFRWNNRITNGVNDAGREQSDKGAEGKSC